MHAGMHRTAITTSQTLVAHMIRMVRSLGPQEYQNYLPSAITMCTKCLPLRSYKIHKGSGCECVYQGDLLLVQ